MVAVLTGDIINSRNSDADVWQKQLKAVLQCYGAEPKDWEIYRGDSFQLAVTAPEALLAAIHIKAAMMQHPGLNARIAIGIGERNNTGGKITEATGTAFLRSGDSFEALKKNTLTISSGLPELDGALNIMLPLATHIIDGWSETVATLITFIIEHPQRNQQEIAQELGRSQSTISETLKRGGYDEINKMENYFRQQMQSP